MSADTAPAAPGEEDVARLLFEFATCSDLSKGPAALDENAHSFARAILALFAPILAEKERRDAADAKRIAYGKWLEELAENPPPPSEALKKLLADYKASGIKSVGLDSPFNACCYRDGCRALEARALAAEADRATFKLALIAEKEAAEAALAAERERCALIAANETIHPLGEQIAAAIRAQGE